MRNLIIIGAGGMGRVIYDTAKESLGYNSEYAIKGFIDDDLSALDRFNGYPPIVGTISTYIPEDGDVFICSIGGIYRRKVMQSIIDKCGVFINLIHNTARIGTGASIGVGNFVGPYTTLAANCIIGDYNFFQQFVIVGHDCVVGSWNRLDSHTMLVGGVQIGNEVNIHTSAVINHNVVIKNSATVGACSFVIGSVKENTTVFGSPARKISEK